MAAGLLEAQFLGSLTLSDLSPVSVQDFALITNRTETPSGSFGSGLDSAPTSSSSSCDAPPALRYILKVCAFWKRTTVPLCQVHLSIPTRNRSPRASDGGPRKSDLREVFFGAGAALGKPEESLNFQYWTCCEVGPVPSDLDRRLHTSSCRQQAKARPSSKKSSVSSQCQPAAASSNDA